MAAREQRDEGLLNHRFLTKDYIANGTLSFA